MILFVQSVLWDLGIPQEAADVLYEDKGACTAMGNAQKPTPRTRHMDIKYFSICEWVDTKLNLADHLRDSHVLSSIGMPISSLATSLRPTLPSIQLLSDLTRTHSSI